MSGSSIRPCLKILKVQSDHFQAWKFKQAIFYMPGSSVMQAISDARKFSQAKSYASKLRQGISKPRSLFRLYPSLEVQSGHFQAWKFSQTISKPGSLVRPFPSLEVRSDHFQAWKFSQAISKPGSLCRLYPSMEVKSGHTQTWRFSQAAPSYDWNFSPDITLF